ncbi:hypothetical protein F0L74_11170 [Chitinophaga agrisoli]|uniref:DUF5723 domain-containing protein n=1 Tax=Chitinophaga agrisoli TaxID=2607653 RepID=A0A5B2VWP9_9BACT|nr:DUF5723 family protein [Chitinophaga agrisoli]KAA2243070.1 hypothetical protein F0L74_11170 [Chitinophaga agrisoli]
MQRILIATLGLLLLWQYGQAQSFAGYHNSHYAGIYGVLTNPASAAGSRYKWDVNIIGVDAKAGNTYISFPKSSLFNMPDTFRRNRDYFLDTASTNRQYGWGMAEVMLPSVLYSIDEKQSVAFTWRLRAVGNGGNVDANIANFFALDYPNPRFNGRNYNVDYAGFYAHSWNELGLSYARVIKDNVTSRIKAGVTLKYLSGIAAGYGVVRNANFVMEDKRNATISSGTLEVAYNEQLDNWEHPANRNFKLFANPGIGADIGVIYEWRPDGDGFGNYESDSWNPDADEYKLRLGASVTDIGGIYYKKAAFNRDLDLTSGNISPDSLKRRTHESVDDYYHRVAGYFTPITTYDGFFMALPTALHLMGDYNIDGRFFVNANAVIGIFSGQKDVSKNYAITQLQITPRFDSKHFGAYMPFVVNRFGQVDAGVGFRAGPLIIGSSSILSNLFRSRINHADGFIALRVVPISFKHRDRDGGGGLFKKQRRQVDCPPM